MTFLEKAMDIENKKESGLSKENTIMCRCPSSYGLEEGRKCKNMGQEECFKCWNREMPNTEPKEDDLQEIKEAMAEAYADGQNDIWELVRKIFRTDCADLQKVFGHSDEGVVIMTFDVQEALAKLKAYEEAQIEVGDVVLACNEVPIVVTNISNNMIFGVDTFGLTSARLLFSDCKKTGKHIDIKSILEQIGE